MNAAPYPAGLLRRLAAAVYDLFLLIGVWMMSVFALLPFTDGRALDGSSPVFRLYILFVPFLLFGWFWTHGGQTLGMKAWRMRIRRTDGSPVDWRYAALRYLGAWLAWLSVVGIVWIAIDPQRRGLQDWISDTETVVEPPQ